VAKTTAVARADKNQPAPHEQDEYSGRFVFWLGKDTAADTWLYSASYLLGNGRKSWTYSQFVTKIAKTLLSLIYTSPSVGLSLKWYNIMITWDFEASRDSISRHIICKKSFFYYRLNV
jgi:hypothetical protein